MSLSPSTLVIFVHLITGANDSLCVILDSFILEKWPWFSLYLVIFIQRRVWLLICFSIFIASFPSTFLSVTFIHNGLTFPIRCPFLEVGSFLCFPRIPLKTIESVSVWVQHYKLQGEVEKCCKLFITLLSHTKNTFIIYHTCINYASRQSAIRL